MDFAIVKNANEAYNFLLQHSQLDVMRKIKTEIKEFKLKWSGLEEMEKTVTIFIEKLYLYLLNNVSDNNEGNKDLIYTSIECYVLQHIHNSVFKKICESHEREDNFILTKSLEMSEHKTTAEQFGAPEIYAVPLTAAVVELANIDTYPTTLEKLNCLCTTYDLIFAELKSGLVEIINRSETNDLANIEIPIIENHAIVPILMTVIIRSKLLHFYSNYYYIEAFGNKFHNNASTRQILEHFQVAIENLCHVCSKSVMPSSDLMYRDLDLLRIMEITGNAGKKSEEFTLIDYQNERTMFLIIASTNENQIT